MWQTIGDVLLDSLIDTAKLLPFLIVIYIIIELLEEKTSLSTENSKLKGKLGVLFGSAAGLVPQCGFSVMAAKLFDNRFITVGTLFAVFISTSDEAFVIMISDWQNMGAVHLLPLILVKVFVGVAVGYSIDGILRLFQKQKGESLTIPQAKVDKADYHARVFQKKEEEFCTSCGREHDERHPFVTYFVSPFLHSLKIAAYIFVVTALFGFIVKAAGDEKAISAFLSQGYFVQPVIASAIGLIPNCASSVILTECYLEGYITFGSCVAGLCANAGLGFVVLMKNTKKWKRNLLLFVGIYAISVATGIVVTAIQLGVGLL